MIFWSYKRSVLRRYAEYGCLILVCAFFVWAGAGLILEDGKNQQMMDFQISNEAFRKINIQEKRFDELKKISEQTHLPFEKLLAVSFLCNYFYEASYESMAVLLTEMAAYERRNPPVFRSISSCYQKMTSPISVYPLPYIISEEGKRQVPWKKVVWEEETWSVYFEIEEKWEEGLPVFSVEKGTVYDFNDETRTLRIKGENGILYAFGNLDFEEGQWEEGEPILAGDVIGWVKHWGEDKKTVKLQLQFLLSSENESWVPYNGLWSVLSEDTKHYTVTQKLP